MNDRAERDVDRTFDLKNKDNGLSDFCILLDSSVEVLTQTGTVMARSLRVVRAMFRC